MLHLDPDTYPCPTHPAEELRPLIERALDPTGSRPPVAFGGNDRFAVYVTCPGDGQQHPQMCKGRYWW